MKISHQAFVHSHAQTMPLYSCRSYSSKPWEMGSPMDSFTLENGFQGDSLDSLQHPSKWLPTVALGEASHNVRNLTTKRPPNSKET